MLSANAFHVEYQSMKASRPTWVERMVSTQVVNLYMT